MKEMSIKRGAKPARSSELFATTRETLLRRVNVGDREAFEEFYVPGEKIDMNRFKSLGVVEQTARHSMAEVDAFFAELEQIFVREDFTKAEVVAAIKTFIPNFEHEEKGKNLDQKM